MNNKNIIVGDLLKIATEQHIDDLISETASIKTFQQHGMLLMETPECIPFGNTLYNATYPGVYFVCYKPEKDEVDRIKYVGYSDSVQGRVNQHVRFFRNGGKSSDKTKDAGFVKKMFKYDSDINNWEIFWVRVPSKWLASKYETICINSLTPEFNSQKMAGV
jgi:hypothetical protein